MDSETEKSETHNEGDSELYKTESALNENAKTFKVTEVQTALEEHRSE